MIAASGKSLNEAKAAMILIHGRGATAESILELAEEFKQNDFAYLAPQAENYSWYPFSFLSPLDMNEPGITNGLNTIEKLIEQIEQAGIPLEKILLLGFSQGACLTTEFAARNAKRFGGVIGLSGGLIGPLGTPRNYSGNFNGTPIFLGCSDIDPHIPVERVQETAEVFRKMGAEVTEKIYRNMGHTVNHDEVKTIREMMEKIRLKSRNQE